MVCLGAWPARSTAAGLHGAARSSHPNPSLDSSSSLDFILAEMGQAVAQEPQWSPALGMQPPYLPWPRTHQALEDPATGDGRSCRGPHPIHKSSLGAS